MSTSSPLLHPGIDRVTMISGAEDDDADKHCEWRDCLKVGLISGFIVAGVVAFILLLLLRPNTEYNDEYGVVFDAGSSHTGLFVYKWPGNERLKGTAVPVDEVYSAGQIPGISSFIDNPSGAGPSLKGLLKDALKVVGSSKRSSTPLYLGATAGMRLVHEVNSTVSAAIMASVHKSLSESSFDFVGAKIVSGKEEGSFGWITVNYLGNVLQTLQKPNLSLGALDLGGASTQITFVPRNASRATKHFRLYGKDYPVYTKSYLCYGVNEIYRRFLSELVKNANYTANVPNPCGNVGYSETKKVSYLWAAPCSCTPNSSLPIGRSTFTFYGSSNSSECRRQVTRLFTYDATCPNATAFTRSGQPSLRGNFLAFSGYYYIAKALNLSSTPTMAEFRTAYEAFCHKTWNDVEKYPGFEATTQSCFSGHYVYALLTQGYGFDNQTWKISFKKTVDNKSLGWTLGYMINATNLIPRNKPNTERLEDKILIPALVACSLFVLIGLCLCWLYIRQKRRRNQGICYVTV